MPDREKYLRIFVATEPGARGYFPAELLYLFEVFELFVNLAFFRFIAHLPVVNIHSDYGDHLLV